MGLEFVPWGIGFYPNPTPFLIGPLGTGSGQHQIFDMEAAWGVVRVDLISINMSASDFTGPQSVEVGMIYDGTETFVPVLSASLDAPLDPAIAYQNKVNVQTQNPFYCSGCTFWIRGEGGDDESNYSALIAISTSSRQQEVE